MTRILVIDNYDSFVFNIVQYLSQLGAKVDVLRNDEVTVEQAREYDGVLLSPGPGTPADAGVCIDIVKELGGQVPIFGVCLGHQAIAEAFGSQLNNMGEVLHGVTTECVVTDPTERLFLDIPSRFEVCRYHSWTVVPSSMPSDLKITAEDDKGFVLAEAHSKYDVRGVQFHPEAFLTQHGLQMIKNWMK